MAAGTVHNSLWEASTGGSVVTSVPSLWAGPAPAALPSFPTVSLSSSLPPPCVWHLLTQYLGRRGGAQRSSRTAEGVQQPQESRHRHCLVDGLSSHSLCCTISHPVSRGCVVLHASSGGRWVVPVLGVPECCRAGASARTRVAVPASLGLWLHAGNAVPQCTWPGHLVPDQHHGQVFQSLHPLHPLPALVDVLH